MKYRANKTVVRHLNGKSTEMLRKGKQYSQDEVDRMPHWYSEYFD